MDVETIQKINALALDLMRQGLASSRDEAVTQAEKIYYKGAGNEAYDSIRRNMGDSLSGTKIPSSGSTSSSSPSTNPSDLPQEKIQQILEENTKFLVKTIKEFQERVDKLEREVSTLRSTQTMYRQPVPERSQVAETIAAPARPASPTPPPTSSAANHPRSGNYKEGDVSIEKFFYMGRK